MFGRCVALFALAAAASCSGIDSGAIDIVELGDV
jgi:hypothetical protein